MTLFELALDGAALREAERIVSLEGRGFPTLVMRWESRLFDQTWSTTVVLDYAIALPPLVVGQARFNEVRLAALVSGAPTKFLYFGTELGSQAPRIAPEMENTIGPSGLYQEFRLDEQTCPVPYLKLIQTTPRIYGNAPQDYYSPPLRVERYDGVAGPEHLADFFPKIVADLDPVPGRVLTDANQGHWQGSRFYGATSIAIKRQGKVVGMHRRVGRVEKEPIPAAVRTRDPAVDVQRAWVAVDLGASKTVVALRNERGSAELVRIGSMASPLRPRDFESPSEVGLLRVGATLKAWRERVVQPLTRWEDVIVGETAYAQRMAAGLDRPQRVAATITELPTLRDRSERKEVFRIRGLNDPEHTETLKRPAPPVIDEDGIGANDPFDPVELYAYYVGLHVNHRARGLFLRWAVTMPAGYSAERRQSLLMAFRRGVFRSLPAGLVPFEDVQRFEVVDAGPAAVPFVVHAMRVFGLQPKGEPIPFFVVDAGATETGMVGGLYRDATADERADGFDRVVEHLEPSAIPTLGGEVLLQHAAASLFREHLDAMLAAKIPFEPAAGISIEGADALTAPSPEGRANNALLRDALRPYLEGTASGKPPAKLQFLTEDRQVVELPISIGAAYVSDKLASMLGEAAPKITAAFADVMSKIGRGPNPHEGVHVFIAGRFGMNDAVANAITDALPKGIKLHRFLEPGRENLAAPTVRTATALGTLGTRFDRVATKPRTEARGPFQYRVGRARHGELAEILGPADDYDLWREMGACTKPEVELLYLAATDDDAVAVDDPRVQRALCSLGAGAVGKRVYLRAAGPATVDVAAGAPGGEPDFGSPIVRVDLVSGTTRAAS